MFARTLVALPSNPEEDTASVDEAAVRDLYQQLMDGWDQCSGAAFASVFTENGDLIG